MHNGSFVDTARLLMILSIQQPTANSASPLSSRSYKICQQVLVNVLLKIVLAEFSSAIKYVKQRLAKYQLVQTMQTKSRMFNAERTAHSR